RSQFTLDDHYQRAVRDCFVTWYEQGLIYRGYRLINWCPRDMSAISDIEVDHTDELGDLVFIRYPATDGGQGVVVATTRAETMLGDTAVAVHPADQRYRDLIGSTVRLPLMDREIPVIADDHVDPDFGTGAVKVTPAHDPNDHEMGQRHALETIDVMTDEARININGGRYAGMDRFEARTAVKNDLANLGLLEKVEERVHSVGHCSRCHTVVEPRLSDQWFVAVKPLAQRAADAVRDGRTTFVPARNAKGFMHWLENLHDWCISRQLWWGHRIPAWYDRHGAILVLRDDPSPEEVAEHGLRQDPDVLDTWFSSQLWPFTTLGWPDDTPDLQTWFPTSVLVTGYDINTFWVSRMLMAGLDLMGEVPFHTVMNHGLVRDRYGKKMSKSFGNVIDPLELIDRYGADALRFALLRAASPGQDVPLAEEWVEGARRFANKLWNAARFVFSQLPDGTAARESVDAVDLQPEDSWILSRLEAARAAADEAYACYDVGRASQTLYHFIWDEFCDWYLELVKQRTDPGAGAVLTTVMDVALRLLHPIMPFVTEELWRTLHGGGEVTLVRAAWPVAMPQRRDETAERRLAILQDAVTALRRFRADHGLAPSQRIDVIAVTGPEQRALLAEGVEAVRRLVGVTTWSFADDAGDIDAHPVGKVVMPGGELFVPLTGLIDLDEERARLQRQLDNANGELERAERKLSNDSFVAKAPQPVVAAERRKVEDWRVAISKLTAQLDELA
ncbi:MAG: valine--tRNA ligase, partial [Nitriliruptorales bacterium]|nr:valine--tRNA ligase [Nitriliruptorales bacterium]